MDLSNHCTRSCGGLRKTITPKATGSTKATGAALSLEATPHPRATPKAIARNIQRVRKRSRKDNLGWAQVWAAKATPEGLRLQVETDPHSWAQYRVNGPLSNMPEFAKAFGCKAGDKMVRKDACVIW